MDLVDLHHQVKIQDGLDDLLRYVGVNADEREGQSAGRRASGAPCGNIDIVFAQQRADSTDETGPVGLEDSPAGHNFLQKKEAATRKMCPPLDGANLPQLHCLCNPGF